MQGNQEDMGASAMPTGLSQAEPEVSALRASIPSALAVAELAWSDGHGLSIGGSSRGIHAPSKIGYWIHDTLREARRYKVCRMGVSNPIAETRTLARAKQVAQGDFETSILAGLVPASGIEARSDETRNAAQPEARARPDAQQDGSDV